MTISRKPVRKPSSVAQTAVAVNVDAIINRGGTVAVTAPTDKLLPSAQPERKSVLLNLPIETIDRIKQSLTGRKVRITRQTWIEEAIQEKLSRELD